MCGSFANVGKDLSANEYYSWGNIVFESLCIKGESGGLGGEKSLTCTTIPQHLAYRRGK